MPLWGNLDNASGNQKPRFANTSNSTSNSTINGTAANTNTYYGNMYGVSVTEEANTQGDGPKVAHAGWVSQKIGTGPVQSINIISGGSGINANGFLLITDNSFLRQGNVVLFNASFTIANTQNTLQSFSTNSAWNVINSITIVNGSLGFSNAAALNVRTNGSNTTWPNLSVTLGGRAGRINYETIVAMGSITGDDPQDNVFFTGV